MSSANLVGALPPDTRLHEYLIERVLGHGGFGITYLARDTLLDKLVAIKEYLPNELAARAEADTVTIRSDDTREAFDWGRNNFVKEARVLARFSHPNLIRVHRFFELNGTAYFVMEYAEGTTLASVLKSEKTLGEARLLSVLLPIALGLEQVHGKGVLHRDIKPDNILLRADGTPVLIDFGAARQNLGTGTLSVMSVVTAGYAPLEQYGTSGTQGPWTDVYALGAVAYRCVTGKKPADAVNRIGTDPVVPALDVCGERYSRHVLTSIDWALAVNSEDRPQSIAQWRDAFEGKTAAPERNRPAAAIESPLESTKIIRPAAPAAAFEATELIRKPAPTVAARWRKRAPAVAAALAAVVLLTLVLVWSRGDPQPKAPAETAEPASESVAVPVESPAPATEAAEPAEAESAPTSKKSTVASAPTEATASVKNAAPASSQEAPAKAASPSKPVPEQQAAAPSPEPSPPRQTAVNKYAPGATFQDCSSCPLMAVLPTGSFVMGSATKSSGAAKWEMPEHAVTMTRAFAIGWFELTVREWQQCVDAKVCPAAKPGPVSGTPARAPVVNVNWRDALTYTGWLAERTGRTYRLPTEAEWEYALRAGTTTSRYWGDDRRGQCEHANGADISGVKRDRTLPAGAEPCDDGFSALAPTGSLKPNAFNLYDMAGNAWEWVLDCWTDNYAKASANGAAADEPNCKRRVIRGGSWKTKPESLRSANRGLSPEEFRGEDLGFRVVAE